MADARVTDQKLLDAFQEGLDASPDQLDTTQWVYIVGFMVDSKPINVKQYEYSAILAPTAWRDLIADVTKHLVNGPDYGVAIVVRLKSDAEAVVEQYVKALSAGEDA